MVSFVDYNLDESWVDLKEFIDPCQIHVALNMMAMELAVFPTKQFWIAVINE